MKKKRYKSIDISVLKNKIKNGLFVVGTNAICELINSFHEYFDFIVLPENYRSKKIHDVLIKGARYGVETLFNDRILNFVNSLNVDGSDVRSIAFLKEHIHKYYSLDEVYNLFKNKQFCIAVALYNIDYDQNLGSILRTCAAFNVDFVVVPNSQQRIFSPVVTRVSMGYNYFVPVVRENFLLAVDNLTKLGFDIVALDTGGENIENVVYNNWTCFIVGNEGSGLTDTVFKKSDLVVRIPTSSLVESLNVTVSLGVALYDRNKKINELKRAV
jgi:tRNA G18 (ribose-2'-O)-methylase SpoU